MRHWVIAGYGNTGRSVARFLAACGERAIAFDTRSAVAEDGLCPLHAAEPEDSARLRHALRGARALVRSPGLPMTHRWVQDAVSADVPVIGDIELFARHVRGPVLAVTGTNGKSTTTALLGAMARAGGVQCAVGGNLGPPALDLLQRETAELYILEISSFQLETTHSLALEAGVVLNVAPDHLDRHASMAEYTALKARLYERCRVPVVNLDDPAVRRMVATHSVGFTRGAPPEPVSYGIDRHQGEPWFVLGQNPLFPVSDIPLRGMHNRVNVLAALALGAAAGLDQESMYQAIVDFTGLPHRMRHVATVSGIQFWNDSKATNVAAACAAVRGLADELGQAQARAASFRPGIVLIAGGLGKNESFAPLAHDLRPFLKMVLTIGQAAEQIDAAMAEHGIESMPCASMSEAVERAAAVARPGDQVVLAPGCASFDMFRDYSQRGEVFETCVHALSA